MEQEIIQQFEEFGFDPPKGDVLYKCVELCSEYDINAEEFMEQWVAFSVSTLDGADPTLPHLIEFERKELIANKEKNVTKLNKNLRTPSITAPLKYQDKITDSVDDDDAVLDTYCNTPKASRTNPRTPARHNEGLFSPASYSPITGTPRLQQKNGGKIVCTFGNSNIVKQATWSSSSTETDKQENSIIVKQILAHNNEPINTKCKFQFDSLMDKTGILFDRLLDIGKEICKKTFGTATSHSGNNNNENTIDDNRIYDLCNADTISSEQFKTIGRISCDWDEMKLTQSSTILIGLPVNGDGEVAGTTAEDDTGGRDPDEQRCHTVSLNFNKISKPFSIFPGQTVMIQGTNPRGDCIYVEDIFTQKTLKPPAPPKTLQHDLRFVIASGPFTHHDDLVYDPLNDLILYCKDNKPNVLILIGPFMDDEHCMINGNVLAETFESFFEKMIFGIVEALGDITICLITSHKDAISHCVYPTPPPAFKKSLTNVHVLPDPCILDINGIIIGATSTDIVRHLLDEEFSINAGDKIKRVVNYLLHQGSFYPLEPPSLEVCFDSTLASKYAKLDIVPNILILPSDQRYFIRDVDKCLAINPGRLVDLNNDGTFARLIISPVSEDSNNVNTSNYVFGQIMKI